MCNNSAGFIVIRYIPPQYVRRIIGNRPNTYTFTKAVAEQVLVEQSGNLPVAIVRPSIGEYHTCLLVLQE
jgi:hypothetical protein